MNCIRQLRPGLLHYGALHFAGDHLNNVEFIVNQDLHDSGLCIDDLKTSVILLDFRCEGQCDLLIKNLIAYFRGVPVKDITAVFNTDIDVSKLDYRATKKVSAMADHCQWFTNLQQHATIWDTDCDFLCLMRRPSIARAKLGNRLLTELNSIRISFGSMCNYSSELVPYQPWFPNHTLPLLLDGYTIRGENTLEHDVTNPLFRTCAINIIAESSAQTGDHDWHSIFVTEKTFKAFGMLQIPIWWAVPGLVSCVKNMGFDVFDDIIDCKYDREYNEDLRLEMIIQELKKLQELGPAQLRRKLQPRLEKNFQRLKEIVQSQNRQLETILKELGLDTQV
jgi:hypothetical protein